jgi:hypothetical protein
MILALLFDPPPDPAWRQGVARSIDSDAAIQVHRAYAKAHDRKRLREEGQHVRKAKPVDKLRDTEYAEERASTRLGAVRLERLFVKAENQEEIRLSWWPDGRMANRPVDVPEGDLVTLLAQGIRDGVLSAQFLPRLIVEAAKVSTKG